VFRIVLSHSRKAYSEVVWRQSTEAFITALENAFHHFGGVPKTLVIDYLKAAVQRGGLVRPEGTLTAFTDVLFSGFGCID
jgi:transposase